MELIESIASYGGGVYGKIKEVLTDDVKQIIISLVKNPAYVTNVDLALLHELIDMDIFKYDGDRVCPNTAIFFEEDMILIKEIVEELSEGIAKITQKYSHGLEDCPPDVKNFIGCIMAGQELHSELKKKGMASSWQSKTGKYEKSKVDFNQSCETYRSFGDDLQNKGVTKGERFASVTIGFGNNNFVSNIYRAKNGSLTDGFYDKLAHGLVDIIPLLITGQLQNDSLKEAAKIANVNMDSKLICIMEKDADKYKEIINVVGQKCADYYLSNMDNICSVLSRTIVGLQGASLENMMMNFWRYMRKMIATKLYDNGFLIDNIPHNGSATIFYENSIKYF
jgi:hypothetical protein